MKTMTTIQLKLADFVADPHLIAELIQKQPASVVTVQRSDDTVLVRTRDSADQTVAPGVERRDGSLFASGTRLTLYELMDDVESGLTTAQLSQHYDFLDQQQLQNILTYIRDNRNQLNAERQEVERLQAANRAYWAQYNSQRFAEIAAQGKHPRLATFSPRDVD